ncbi:lyase family protein [Corynebacterium guangdongense]|uniref:3-carboxy-cis,cis-muconate cycloisomerase n=1 Tax=Corynebacterium guangdongense TaxID=1783348 RepID=A0ABU1ZZ96_9CORY|nr:lyase family protein [Corynebacterium guangdongense]MDR7330080.1 3-carboxy-cis,cis-muconate cycloisomerase [Corynebacterium guangdongense]WJZ18638.1 3-carboxy-cis,cis-muconate cycloisomerase [Corynebacterium guangdongense]
MYDQLAAGGPGEAVAAELSDEAWVAALLDVEDAIARSACTVGLVTEAQRDSALRAVDRLREDVDVPRLARDSAAGANPAIPLARELKRAADDPAAVHLGATSQDVIDSALSLVLLRAWGQLASLVAAVEDQLTGLADAHRSTPVMARTLGQQAEPTTFGLIAAGWWQGVATAHAALADAVGALPVQYAGAAGNLRAVGNEGIALHDALATELGLADRPLVWHTDRQPFVAVALAAARLAGAMRKIAGDVVVHSATEVGELREATPGGSSSMPHKANPAAAIACDGYARRTPALAATMLDSLDSRSQRGIGSWHAEWQTLRDLLSLTASATSRLHASLDGIVVDAEAMARNMTLSGHDAATADTGQAEAIIDATLQQGES